MSGIPTNKILFFCFASKINPLYLPTNLLYSFLIKNKSFDKKNFMLLFKCTKLENNMSILNINNTSPVFKGGSIQILSKNNPTKEYLFNEVIDIVKKNQVPAIFHRDGINISASTRAVIEKLKESGIKFNKLV